MKEILTEIVKRAIAETVVSIGQLSHSEELELNRAVRNDYLSKGKGGPYPNLKTVYAVPGFDFSADRSAWIEYWRKVSEIDAARLGPTYLLRTVTHARRSS